MTTPDKTNSETHATYQPLTAQLQRAESLNRFNFWAVSVPVVLLLLLVVALMILMVWQALSSSPEEPIYSLLSGLADLILIFLVILPAMLLCAVGPAAAGFIIHRAVKRRQLKPEERRSKLQLLLWRIDRLLVKTYQRLRDSYLDRAARPIIKSYARWAYAKAVIEYIRQFFRRAKG